MSDSTPGVAPNRRDFLRVAGGSTFAAGLFGMATACGSSSGGKTAGGAYKGQVMVTHLNDITEVAPYHIAKELGYFEDAGLDLELVGFSGGSEGTQAIATGMGFGSPATVSGLIAFAEGAPLRLVSGFYNAISVVFLVPSDSPLQSAKDLRGKKIAVSRPGSNTTYIATRVLRQQGLEPGRDAEIVFVGGPPDAWTSTEQDLTHVAWSAPPLSQKLINSGKARLLFRANEYVHVTSVSNWVTERFMQENPDAVRNWIQALQRTFETIREDPDTAAKAYANAINIDRALAHDSLAELTSDFDTAIDSKGVENALNAAVTLGHIKSVDEVDLNKVVAREFASK